MKKLRRICARKILDMENRLSSQIAAFQTHWPNHWVQRKMISVDNFFSIFEIIIFCFVVAICDLVHAVEATYGLP